MRENRAIYDTFNARYLNETQVADGFIPNNQFHELQKNSHSLLMGPRGCGKTTLLKMLTPVALTHYDQTNGTNWYEQLPFLSIYIPTDRAWKKQLAYLEEQTISKVKPTTVDLISRGTVSITVLQSMCSTFLSILKIRYKDDYIQHETRLAKALIEEWEIDTPILPTLSSIEVRLSKYLTNVNASIRKLIHQDEQIDFINFFYKDYFDLARQGCEVFDLVVGRESEKKWAFCFDELEIAPNWLSDDLLKNLRSVRQDYIFKLTTAPLITLYDKINSDESTPNATVGNDFNVVKVWTSKQKEFSNWADFSNLLVTKRLSQRLNKSIDPIDLFGTSNLDRALEALFKGSFNQEKPEFTKGTITYHAFKTYAEQDEKFRKILEKKGINPDEPEAKNSHIKDTFFRKAKPWVVHRLHSLKGVDSYKSRKVVPLYYGVPYIYDFCDGNPRVLIGLIDELIDAVVEKKDISAVGISTQSRIIKSVSERFLNTISFDSEATVQSGNGYLNIKQILEEIGKYFFKRTTLEDFNIDPVVSFIVDDTIPDKLLELINFALYHGAIIHLDDVIVGSLVGRRYRLAFTLSPFFQLISRDGQKVNLIGILNNNIIKPYGLKPDEQQNLF